MRSPGPAGPALVTGAAGFLGSHLVRRLRRDGVPVVALLRPGSDPWRLADVADVPIARCDLADLAALKACVATAEPATIFHFAGDIGARRFAGEWDLVRAAQQTNVAGLVNLLEAAAAARVPPRMVVRLGGLEEYGSGPAPFAEAQREAPRSPYSASQVAGTHLAQALQPHLPFALATLRPTLIYGPDQSTDFLVPAMIEAFAGRRRFAIRGGDQRRDLVHVDDLVAAAVALAGRTDLAGTVLNVASGEAPTVRAIAEAVADLLDARHLLDVAATGDRTREIMDLRGDASLAERVLGWRPRIGLHEGLAETVAAYRARVREPVR